MSFIASQGDFTTSVRLIRGGYRGAAPRAAGTGSVKYVLLSRSGSLAPQEQVLANAHIFMKHYSILLSRRHYFMYSKDTGVTGLKIRFTLFHIPIFLSCKIAGL